jgi:hypothetical protein
MELLGKLVRLVIRKALEIQQFSQSPQMNLLRFVTYHFEHGVKNQQSFLAVGENHYYKFQTTALSGIKVIVSQA